eukprot:7206124-Lingulodinium_polyedra.AAC.1
MGLVDPQPDPKIHHGQQAGMPDLVVPLRGLDPREPPPEGCVGALQEEALSVGQLAEHGQFVGWV